uniref:NADH-quinone oxidoreductase subunit J n=1 Tax=Thermofilum pendens TaxID=2269 RepID=A0A7C4FF97_THEPE
MNPLNLFTVYLLLAGAAAVVSAALAVKTKEDFYAAVLLGITGLSVAALIGLLGYTFLAVFHVLVYVGATVMFVIFGVVLVGRGAGSERHMTLPAAITSLLVACAVYTLLRQAAVPRVSADLAEAAAELFKGSATALVFLALALASLVIAGLSIASGRGGER